MNKDKRKVITATIVGLILLVIAVIAYKNTPANQKLKESKDIMEEREIEPTKEDKQIVKEVLKNEKIEHSYITHDEDTLMLTIKYKAGVSEEEQAKLSGKYLDELTAKYPDKNININTIVEDEK